jgi:hypothetical protein
MNLNQLMEHRLNNKKPNGKVILSLCKKGTLKNSIDFDDPFVPIGCLIEIGNIDQDYRSLHGLDVTVAYYDRVDDAIEVISRIQSVFVICLTFWSVKNKTFVHVSHCGKVDICKL